MKRNFSKWIFGHSISCCKLSPPPSELQWAGISQRNMASKLPNLVINRKHKDIRIKIGNRIYTLLDTPKASKPSKSIKSNSREKEISPSALGSTAQISETSLSSSRISVLKNASEHKVLQNIQEPPKAVNSNLVTSTSGKPRGKKIPASALGSSAQISDTSSSSSGTSTPKNVPEEKVLENIQELPKAVNCNHVTSTKGNSREKKTLTRALRSSAQISETSSLSSETSILKDAPKFNILQNIQDASYLNKSKPLMESGAPSQKVEIPQNMDYLEIPSVSRILKETMSPASVAALHFWEEKMIRELGEVGFKNYKQATFQLGNKFHSLIQRFLNEEDISERDLEDNPAVKGCWHSIRPVLQKVNCVHNIENHVVHQDLNYRGYVDCVAEYVGRPVVVEWKHKTRKAPGINYTYDNPLQLMAYVGALNHDPQYPFQVQDCLLAVAYTDGSPAQLYLLNQQEKLKYWQAWLVRLKQFQDLNNKQSLTSDQQQTKAIMVELQTTCETGKLHDSSKPISYGKNELSDSKNLGTYGKNEPSDTEKLVSYEQNKPSNTDKPISCDKHELFGSNKSTSNPEDKPSDSDKPVSCERNIPSDLDKQASQGKETPFLAKLRRLLKW